MHASLLICKSDTLSCKWVDASIPCKWVDDSIPCMWVDGWMDVVGGGVDGSEEVWACAKLGKHVLLSWQSAGRTLLSVQVGEGRVCACVVSAAGSM
eukprot:364869-Chlamydomonas_euryale.AAC.16